MGVLIKTGLPRLEEICRRETMTLVLIGGADHPDVEETVKAYKKVWSLLDENERSKITGRIVDRHTGNVQDLEQEMQWAPEHAQIQLENLDRIWDAYKVLGLVQSE